MGAEARGCLGSKGNDNSKRNYQCGDLSTARFGRDGGVRAAETRGSVERMGLGA